MLEKRVFEGTAIDEGYGEWYVKQFISPFVSVGVSDMLGGLDGKRVKVTVEVVGRNKPRRNRKKLRKKPLRETEEERIKRNLRELQELDRLIEESLKVSDDALNFRVTI